MIRRLSLLLIAACWLLPAPVVRAGDQTSLLIERSTPSIVLVGTFSPTDSPRFIFRGSGFVVGNGNFVVTNAHVLPSPEVTAAERRVSVQVRGTDGDWRLRSARLAAVDREHDLALLSIDGEPVPALPIADERLAKAGRSIILMGFPVGGALGFTTVSHRGMISAVTAIALPPPSARSLSASALRQLREGSFDILQLDATAYPGNSGGPVLDRESGAVLGVVNMVLTKAGHESALSQPSGISYAIPASFVKGLLSSANSAN